MYHPSNGSPRTANTWGYIAVHEKQEANRAATASHGELPRLPSREGMKGKTKLEEKTERDQTLGYLGVVNPVTSIEVSELLFYGTRAPGGPCCANQCVMMNEVIVRLKCIMNKLRWFQGKNDQ
ncbi:hypothetical protein AVEN_116876-1 [Araneus ventricosus]|uniref:Uncharacterized protein n=1 Tax=Araneus ventricosus TaxID=182803 RepID=A0A4Y2QIG9_ARAVE|nr:hypothetical protein AVEN_116876-1 [Araneus ventricosus]